MLAVICDGMGGLSQGELASATVVRGFADWFVRELPGLIRQRETEDQSYVAREVKRGNMTLEQARTDTRRNVLLQCIGASAEVMPELKEGKIKFGNTYLLCSDGFRHELTEEEM